MEPSIGRIVHYHSYGTPGGEYSSVARAALVTEVGLPGPSGDYALSLAVFNPTGLFFPQGVPFSPEPKPGHWSWPKRPERTEEHMAQVREVFLGVRPDPAPQATEAQS